MPKVGMEPIRRAALVNAAIAEIGAARSLDVTVGQIARRAGMSSGLAHHYFGGKEQMFIAAMRHILASFGRRVAVELKAARTPHERLNGIIAASFDAENFEPEVISAWLTFYVQAQTSSDANRLLRIYVRRLHSNLVFCLRQLTSDAQATQIADGLGAMIDGFYIRQALHEMPLDRFATMAMVWDYLDLKLEQFNGS